MRIALGPAGFATLCLFVLRGCDETRDVRATSFSSTYSSVRYVAPGTALTVEAAWGTVTNGEACNKDTLDYDDFSTLDRFDITSTFRCDGTSCQLLGDGDVETGVSMPGDGQWFPAVLVRPLAPGTLVVEAQMVRDGMEWDGQIDTTAELEVVEPTALDVRYPECLDGPCVVTSAASRTGVAISVAIAARFGMERMVAAPDEVTVMPPVGLRCGIRSTTMERDDYACFVDATEQAVTVEARWGAVVGRVVIPPARMESSGSEEPTDLHDPP